MPLRVELGSWYIISCPPLAAPWVVPPVKVQAKASAVTSWSSLRPRSFPQDTAAPNVPYTGLERNPRAWVDGIKSPAIRASTS